jgi:hypothetical protein
VVKALARDPAARYQTAQQLLEEIEELARTRRLKLSAHDLALYVRGIFAPQIATWESARSGRRAARTLPDENYHTRPDYPDIIESPPKGGPYYGLDFSTDGSGGRSVAD